MKTLSTTASSVNFFDANPLLVALGQDQAAIAAAPPAVSEPAKKTGTALLTSRSPAKYLVEEIAWVVLGLSGVGILVLSFWGL
jgi:hypothetical protein